MSRSVLVLSLLLCAVFAPAAQAAQSGLTRVHVDVTFEFEYTTKWEQPKYLTFANCYSQNFVEGKGSEALKLKTRKPERMIFAIEGNYGMLVAPGRGRGSGGLAKLGGSHVRSNRSRAWTEPGSCGGSASESRPETDCGTRLPNFEVLFIWFGHLNPMMGGDHSVPNREQEKFDNCTVHYPKGSPGEAWNLRRQRLPLQTVLKRRKFQVGDSMKWEQKAPAKGPGINSTSKLKWTAKFVRVKLEKPRR